MVDFNGIIVLMAALVDSLNPCPFGVLIFLFAYLSARTKSGFSMLMHGLTFILAVFLAYLSAGVLILEGIIRIGTLSTWFYKIAATVFLFGGLFEIKDYFWNEKGWSPKLSPHDNARIKMYAQRVAQRYSSSFWLGIFVTFFELVYAGAVYVCALMLLSLSKNPADNVIWLIRYNLLFILPLLIILYTSAKGTSTERLEAFRQRNRGLMRLITGVALVLLSVRILLVA